MRIEEILKIKRQWYYYVVGLLFDNLQVDNWIISYYHTYYNQVGKVFADLNPCISLMRLDKTKSIRIIVDVECPPNFQSYMYETLDGVPELVISTDSLDKNRAIITETLSAFILEDSKLSDN